VNISLARNYQICVQAAAVNKASLVYIHKLIQSFSTVDEEVGKSMNKFKEIQFHDGKDSVLLLLFMNTT